jgi:arylsulfatase A-like enzyme
MGAIRSESKSWFATLSSVIFMVLTTPVIAAGLLTPDSRSNIIVIMTDDLDEMLLETAIGEGFMPNLESTFVASGIRMNNSFVSNSLCCPSRSTFLTGQYTHNHGVLTNHKPYGFAALDDSSTLATWLTDAGYLTGFVGKYLNGYWGKQAPGGSMVERGYVPPGWHYWQGLLDPTTYDVYDYYLLNGMTGTAEYYTDRYQTELLAEKAVGFIDSVEAEDDAAPFFMWVSTLTPHSERSQDTIECTLDTGARQYAFNNIRAAPAYSGTAATVTMPKHSSFNETNIEDKPAWLQGYSPSQFDAQEVACIEAVFRGKLESMRSVDDLIGDIVEAIERNGESSQTVIIFTSDNGFLYGQHRLTQKLYAYEEAIRVPLYIRDLTDTRALSEDYAVVNNDLAPTIADLAGAVPGIYVDGRSMLPLFDEVRPASWRKRFLVEHYFGYVPNYAALRGVTATPILYAEYKPAEVTGNGWGGCEPGLCELYFLGQDHYQNNSQQDSPQLQNMISGLEKMLQGLRFCKDGTCQAIEDQ